jgi:hypothetical protein
MSRNVILYSNLYKDPQNIKQKLQHTITHRQIDNFNIGEAIVCSDFTDLAASVVGSTLKDYRNELYGHPTTLADPNKINYDLTSKWTCLVFLTDNNDDPGTIRFLRHPQTGIRRIKEKPQTTSEKDIMDGYSGSGDKMQTMLISDLEKDKWLTDCTFNITNNMALFFRSDAPYVIDPQYQNTGGILQVYAFGDRNNAD